MECRAETQDIPNNRNPTSAAAEMDSVVDGDDEEADPLSTPASSSAAAQGSQEGVFASHGIVHSTKDEDEDKWSSKYR
jgi:hypothetical protein